jgi:hypothetical protein
MGLFSVGNIHRQSDRQTNDDFLVQQYDQSAEHYPNKLPDEHFEQSFLVSSLVSQASKLCNMTYLCRVTVETTNIIHSPKRS